MILNAYGDDGEDEAFHEAALDCMGHAEYRIHCTSGWRSNVSNALVAKQVGFHPTDQAPSVGIPGLKFHVDSYAL